ncbi:hypothetical protein [Bradyrhizobium sp. CAR08]
MASFLSILKWPLPRKSHRSRVQFHGRESAIRALSTTRKRLTFPAYFRQLPQTLTIFARYAARAAGVALKLLNPRAILGVKVVDKVVVCGVAEVLIKRTDMQ